MNYEELEKKYQQVFDLAEKNQVYDALILLESLVKTCTNKDLISQLESHKSTYSNILKYSFELANDPQREEVYKRLLKSIVELADEIKEDIIVQFELLSYCGQKKRIRAASADIRSQLIEISEKNELLSASNENPENSEASTSLFSNLFDLIWLTDDFKQNEIELLKDIIKDNNISWNNKSLIVSALTLSIFRYFDSDKMELLLDFYEYREHEVWQRAMVGIVFNLILYDYRLYLYPQVINRFKSIRDEEGLEKNIERIIIQIIKSKDTEKITKKIQEELFPEIMKIKSKLDTKLDLDNILSADSLDEMNPEWETVFEETPGVYDKFEEFSQLQMEGSDVFMSAFSMLKQFDFFRPLQNWFVPFFKENPTIFKEMESIQNEFDIGTFVENMEKSSFLCNSDKYSFSLNVRHMPAQQRNMIQQFFNMELEAMNELDKEDALIDQSTRDQTVFKQYIQDLYRFFKLYPLKKEFTDIFEIPFKVNKLKFFKIIIDDASIYRDIAEFYFQKNHYSEAANIFEDLIESSKSFELIEKTAFCYQQLGQFEKAVEYYHKAEILGKNKSWVYKKLGLCYRRLKNYEKSLEFYKEAEKLEGENLYIQTYLGHTYMEMENYEEALKYYFKVEYLAPDNHKIQRPIAWCSFVSGKLDNAEKYFLKVIEKEGNQNDYINLGHVLWCKKDTKGAIEQYQESLIRSKNDISWLEETFMDDEKHLIKHDIEPIDIFLMVDYMKLQLNER